MPHQNALDSSKRGQIKMVSKFTIGVVGGMGSYATLDFFQRLLSEFPAVKEWDRPRIIIDNYCTMPSRVRAILYNEQEDVLIDMLNESIRNLINCGATHIVLACNTSHYFLDKILIKHPEYNGKICHIIKELNTRIVKDNILSFFLLATEGTIQTKIFNKHISLKKCHIQYPSSKDFALIRKFIEDVKTNSITNHLLEEFFDYINSRASDVVVLGCTELPVLYRRGLEAGLSCDKIILDPLEETIKKMKEEFKNESNNIWSI